MSYDDDDGLPALIALLLLVIAVTLVAFCSVPAEVAR